VGPLQGADPRAAGTGLIRPALARAYRYASERDQAAVSDRARSSEVGNCPWRCLGAVRRANAQRRPTRAQEGAIVPLRLIPQRIQGWRGARPIAACVAKAADRLRPSLPGLFHALRDFHSSLPMTSWRRCHVSRIAPSTKLTGAAGPAG